MNIEIRHLTKHFEDEIIFSDFSADITENRTTAIIGESGRGKTTLLRMIAGLDRTYEGRILNAPQRLTFLFQENALLPWKNVVENIAFPVLDILPEKEVAGKIRELLALTYLTGHETKHPHELSGGMQRRVALCRALIYPADFFLLDEPFSGLDASMQNRIADSVLSHFGKRKTIVVATHNESIIARCDSVIDCDRQPGI